MKTIKFTEWLEKKTASDEMQFWVEAVDISPEEVMAARGGDQRMWGKLQDLVTNYLRASMRMNQQDAEDVAQETMMTMMSKIGDIEPGAVKSYALDTAQNKAKNLFRGRDREQAHLKGSEGKTANVDEVDPVGKMGDGSLAGNPAVDAIGKERISGLMKMVQGMDEPYRSAIINHYIKGMSIDDIAGQTQQSSGTVKSWLSRARTKLRGDMNPDDAFEHALSTNKVFLEQCLIKARQFVTFRS